MTRYAARADANQPHVFRVARSLGLKVWPTYRLGNGFPDCLVCYADRIQLWEIKDGAKSPSQRRLTPDEQAFKDMGFPVVLIECDEDIINAAKSLRGLARTA